MREKPRLLFAKNVVRGAKRTQLSRSLADIEYSCGSTFSDIECEDDHILKKVFVRQNLKCSDTIEFAYYTAGFESVCFYCGADENDQHPDHYPICTDCASGGKNPYPRRKRLPATSFIFENWFHKVFVQAVSKHIRQQRLETKAQLVLDN